MENNFIEKNSNKGPQVQGQLL